jgi:hypothetical protein
VLRCVPRSVYSFGIDFDFDFDFDFDLIK